MNRDASRVDQRFMDTVVELAFEGLRLFLRLLAAALEPLIDGLRAVFRAFLHIILEIFVDVIAESCGRGWRRLHQWVGRVTGLPRLAVPLTILLVLALIAGIYLVLVMVGRLFF